MNPFDLAGKVALVTGASAGLGAAIAVALARPAPTSCATATRARPKRPATRSSRPAAAPAIVAANLNDRGARSPGPGSIEALGGSTSSSTTPAPCAASRRPNTRDEDWDYILEVNLTSVFRLCARRRAP